MIRSDLQAMHDHFTALQHAEDCAIDADTVTALIEELSEMSEIAAEYRKTATEKQIRLDKLDRDVAEAYATIRFKGPGFVKLASLLFIQVIHSVFPW